MLQYVKLCSNENGSFNFSHLSGFLHSRHSPQKEARRFAEELYKQIEKEKLNIGVKKGDTALGDTPERNSNIKQASSPLALIVIGIGWGYLIEELVKIYFQTKSKAKESERIENTEETTNLNYEFFFYEPISQVYKTLKEKGRWEALQNLGKKLGQERRERLFGKLGELQEKIQKRGKLELLFHISPSYKRLFPELLSETARSFARPSGLQALDKNTARHFLRQWTRNAFRLSCTQETIDFISGIPKTKDSACLHTKKEPKPFVMYCGADPYLLQDLKLLAPELLSKEKSRVFLIASDSALGPLLASQYKIDLAICVDSGVGTLYHLHAAEHFSSSYFPKEKIKTKRWPFPLLSWSGALPALDNYFSKIYYYRSTLPFDQILGMGPLSKVTEWQNTARNPLGLALYIAYLLGAEKLYSVGVSFRTYGRQSHEKATGYQEYALGRTNRVFSLEMYKTANYPKKYNSTEKNWNWQGALALASHLGLGLEKIRDVKEEEIKKRLTLSQAPFILKSDLWERRISTLRVATKEIRPFIKSQTSATLLSQLKELGLANELWSRYIKML